MGREKEREREKKRSKMTEKKSQKRERRECKKERKKSKIKGSPPLKDKPLWRKWSERRKQNQGGEGKSEVYSPSRGRRMEGAQKKCLAGNGASETSSGKYKTRRVTAVICIGITVNVDFSGSQILHFYFGERKSLCIIRGLLPQILIKNDKKKINRRPQQFCNKCMN